MAAQYMRRGVRNVEGRGARALSSVQRLGGDVEQSVRGSRVRSGDVKIEEREKDEEERGRLSAVQPQRERL